jgi:hypothetical protein
LNHTARFFYLCHTLMQSLPLPRNRSPYRDSLQNGRSSIGIPVRARFSAPVQTNTENKETVRIYRYAVIYMPTRCINYIIFITTNALHVSGLQAHLQERRKRICSFVGIVVIW